MLELLDPVEDEDELELDGVDEDELDDDVLEVLGVEEIDELLELLGAGLVELEVLEVEGSVGDVTPLLSHPIEAASPRVIAPPLRRRRKSRRSASALSASFSSIFRSFWCAIPRRYCKDAARRESLIRKKIGADSRPEHGPPSGTWTKPASPFLRPGRRTAPAASRRTAPRPRPPPPFRAGRPCRRRTPHPAREKR